MKAPVRACGRRGTEGRRVVGDGLLLGYGGGLALHLLHAGHRDADALSPLLHWLRDSTLALPLTMAVAVLGGVVSRRLVAGGLTGPARALATALPIAAIYAAAVVPAGIVHGLLFPSHATHGLSFAQLAVPNASVAFLSALALLLATSALTAVPRRRGTARALAAAASALAVLVPVALTPASAAAPVQAAVAGAACDASTAADRTYDVAAVEVELAYNRWGEGNPQAQIYVLQDDKRAVLDWYKKLGTTSSNRRLRPRPLVIRANEGECVQVKFANELPNLPGEGLPQRPRASMSVRGVPVDIQSSGGSHVGYNDDSTVSNVPGSNTITYYWKAPSEGMYFFNDTASPAGSEADGGSLSSGLYGSFVVEPAGSQWRDIRTNRLLYAETGSQSGELYLEATIIPPTGRPFREAIQIAQDELPLTSTFAFNYGSEPQYNRDANKCPDCVGEETSLSSWAYGDPSMVKLASGTTGPWKPRAAGPVETSGAEDCNPDSLPGFDADSCFTSNVVHAYVGDPIKFRYGLAGVKETHVFHMHAHQWLAEDKDTGGSGPTPGDPGPGAKLPQSTTIDSQTFGPMETFTADLLFGAGSKPGTIGDSIFHCHLYPHFADGFWALFRTHDVYEDGTGRTADGVVVSQIQKVPAGGNPPAPTADNPGYPRFIPGKVGWRAPQPPLSMKDGAVEAKRYVAGRALQDSDPAVVTETAVRMAISEGKSKPGAPFRDPCPPGAREVTYKVASIQTDLVYNERGDHDTQGRVLVLASDVADILAGRKKPEPLFARVNAGDCVNWELTNHLPNWFGNDSFQKLTQTNMFGQHIHLVKFDVLASDGSSNGWNYQQAAFSRAQADFNASNTCNPDTGASCRLSLPADYDPTTKSSAATVGQTIRERWFADYELRTVFTHDHHFAAIDQNRGQFGALVVEPKNMDFRDPRVSATAWRQPINDPAHAAAAGKPVCTSSCVGEAAGAVMDAIGPGADDDFRDFGLAVADFVPLTKKGGNPQLKSDTINPPFAPEEFPDDDPGVMGVNYRNAPLELRKTKNGSPVDPGYAFSSHVFGDPMTPVLQTYNGDNVRVRLIQGSQEEQHQVMVHGLRWRKEPNDPESPMINAAPVGVSEAFNFEVPTLTCATGEDCRGDYLYTSSGVDDIALGMWGVLRVNGGKVPGLPELPDNLQSRTGSVPTKSATALAPPARTSMGNPCKTGAPLRTFNVVAMSRDIEYNNQGEHDPYGMLYALASDEAAIKAGTKKPEPLVLRINEGDCVEVTLTNKLPTNIRNHRGTVDGDAPVPAEPAVARMPGMRVSLHAQLLKYDVRGSDGAAIGFNRDQTVGPGSSMTYKWYAEEVTPGDLGGANLTDYGDVRGHRHHGLFAGLIVEPKGATYHDPKTGREIASGTAADIRVPGRDDFRENVVFFQDGLNVRTASGALIADPQDHPPVPGEPAGGGLDPEDTGEKAFNYRNEPFRLANRLGYEPVSNTVPDGAAMAAVYDSHRHGDPATPVFRGYSGDELVVRVLQGSDKPRQHAYQLAGHSFKTQPDDPGSRTVGTLSGLTVNSAVNAYMGASGKPGDYLYGCAVGFFHRSGGLWGMYRVYPQPGGSTDLLPTAVPAADDPRAAGTHPLLPLELDTVQADVFDDLNRNGVRDAGEPAVTGATVKAMSGTTLKAQGASGTDGQAYISLRDGSYGVQVGLPAGYAVQKVPTSVTVAGDNVRVKISVALRKVA